MLNGSAGHAVGRSRILPHEQATRKLRVPQFPSGGSTDTAPEPSSRWLNYILIGGFAIAAVAMVIIIAASLIVPPIIQRTVDRYTSNAPMKIVQQPLPQDEREALDDRVEAFADAIEEGQHPEPLLLSGQDLNALLQKLWTDEELPGEMALRIEDGRLRSDISIPLEPDLTIGPFTPKVGGRYLNGTVTFRIALENNVITADIERFVMNDKTLPGWIVDAFEREYVEGQLLKNADLREFTDKLARIQVSADSILLEPAAF